jgi:membrane protein insertase Oxa1/YidC/SpoIIIJ
LILTIPVTVQWPAVTSSQAVFCYWSTSAIFTLIQSSVLSLPSVSERVNPGLKADLQQIYSQSLMPEECLRLAKIIETGEEGYTPVEEEEVEKDLKTYVGEQNRQARKGL